MPDQIHNQPGNGRIAIGVLALLIGLIGAASFLGIFLDKEQRVSWMVLTFGGFGVLLGLLFLGATIFRTLGLQDTEHALALPRHSIRSLLTFLIFMFLMVFVLYSTQSIVSFGSQRSTLSGISTADKDNLINAVGIEKIIEMTLVTAKTGEAARWNVIHAKEVKIDEKILAYFDKILIALFGISTTIIGFYFGSRAKDAPKPVEEEPQDPPDEPDPTNKEEHAGDEADGGQFSVSSPMVVLEESAAGGYAGAVTIASDSTDANKELGARFVPSTTHDQPTDEMAIKAVRNGDVVTLSLPDLKEDHLSDEAQIALYFVDEEERAQTVPVKLAAADADAPD